MKKKEKEDGLSPCPNCGVSSLYDYEGRCIWCHAKVARPFDG